MLSSARRICYRILNPKIVHDKYQIKSDVKLPFYPIVGLKQTKTGVMRLNKPDNNNNVTEECSDELFRFLTSFQHDHTVENVWLYNIGAAFSGGADYEELVYNPSYLDKLMRLSIRVGQFNKPIFAKIDGSVRGIAAYLVTMFSTPLGTQRSALRLDQTSKGFVPIFGGTHKLSRLPCNIGLYLALTGDKLDSDQMNRAGFLRGKVRDQHSTKRIMRHLSDANLFMKHYYSPSSHGISEVRRQNQILLKMNYFDRLLQKTQKQILSSQENVRTKFALNQYRYAQTQYFNTIKPENSFTQTQLKVNNYFQMRHDRPFQYMREKNIVQEGNTQNNVISRLPAVKMLKIFGQDTIEKVMEQLRNDGSQWARKTEEMIRKKDPLSIHLTFKLIKDAKERSWVQCLEQQYKVARRIINISKIKTLQISKGRSIKILQNPHSNLKIESIPKQIVDQFFKPTQKQQQIFDHDTPNHSFLPTSEYWRQYPDAARNYLNRTFFDDYHSKLGQVEVRRFLHQNKIDYRDKSFNIPTLRQYLYKQEDYGRLIQVQKQRLKAVLNSQIDYGRLKQSRRQYMEAKIKEGSVQKMIEQQIKLYFQSKFQQKYSQLQKTAKIAGKQSRMQIIRKYVKVLTQNIVMRGQQIEDIDRDDNVRHAGVVRFDQKGSDVFHAETIKQSLNNQLNILKNAYKNDKSVQKLSGMDPNKPKEQYMFFHNQFSDWQFDLIKQDAALRLNYGKTILPRQVAKKYRYLIQKAAKTSQQIAALVGWQNTDIESVLINAPKAQSTFRRFAQKILQNSNQAQNIEKRITQLNQQYKVLQRLKQEELPELMKQKQPQSVGSIFFNSNIIPRPFKIAHLQLLEQVIKFFSQKYSVDGRISHEVTSDHSKKTDIIKKWAGQGLRHNFSRLLKSDVEYVFSYLVIIHLKQMLGKLKDLKTAQIGQIINVFRSNFGVNFSGVNNNQFGQYIIQYLYDMLDMHQDSKHRIIFPQTKLLELINRLKIDLELQNKIGVSFETLMALIAKDRKMIRDSQNGKQPLLGYDPQITMNMLKRVQQNLANRSQLITYNSKRQQFNFNLLEEETEHLLALSRNLQAQNKQMKRLVLGFPHYLRRFQAMMHKIAGNTMFLPKQLYELGNKKLYQNAKGLLRVELNNEQWFRSKIRSAIKNLFDFRYKQETRMSEGQLRMFDQQFKQFFKPEMMRVLLKYEDYFEQNLARALVGEDKELPGTNQQIKSLYLDIKSQIKNPRALKIFNNLVMAQNVIKDRQDQLNQLQYKGGVGQDLTKQQRRDIDQSSINSQQDRTIERLSKQMFRYPDMYSIQPNQKNVKQTKKALGYQWDYKPNYFLDELKVITNKLDKADLKEELRDRLRRIQALNL